MTAVQNNMTGTDDLQNTDRLRNVIFLFPEYLSQTVSHIKNDIKVLSKQGF